MNVEEFNKVLDNYESLLEDLLVESMTMTKVTSWDVVEDHIVMSRRRIPWKSRQAKLLDMITKARVTLKEGDEGKFYRWLGFIQCGLWMLETYSINELRLHNRGNCSLTKETNPDDGSW